MIKRKWTLTATVDTHRHSLTITETIQQWTQTRPQRRHTEPRLKTKVNTVGSKATINPAKLMNGPHRGTKSLIQKFNLCIHSREQTLTAQTPFFFFYTRVNSKTELTCVCVVCVYHQVFPPVLATTCTSKEYKKKLCTIYLSIRKHRYLKLMIKLVLSA